MSGIPGGFVEPASTSAWHDAREPRCVHTITDRFSMANTYLIADERLVVVDPGSALNVRLLQAYLQRFLRRSPGDIDLVVLTHLHTDHIAGVEALRQFCAAPIAASVVVRELATEAQTRTRGQSPITQFSPALGETAGKLLPGPLYHLDLFPPAYERQARLIDHWLEDTAGLPGHPSWRVIATPGHTPESICLYNPFSRELLCGDSLTTIQGGAPLLRGSTNRRQLEESLKVLRSLAVNYLYPGHGRAIPGESPLTNVDVEW